MHIKMYKTKSIELPLVQSVDELFSILNNISWNGSTNLKFIMIDKEDEHTMMVNTEYIPGSGDKYRVEILHKHSIPSCSGHDLVANIMSHYLQ